MKGRNHHFEIILLGGETARQSKSYGFDDADDVDPTHPRFQDELQEFAYSGGNLRVFTRLCLITSPLCNHGTLSLSPQIPNDYWAI